MDAGEIAQSTLKGKAMEGALASAFNDAMPHAKEKGKKKKAKK